MLVAGLLTGLLGAGTAGAVAVREGEAAPEITGGPWINSEALSLEKLRGRVVIVEFWTFGCSNCQNVIPQLRDWHGKYQAAGLTIVGVHAPEFTWERPYDKVVQATRDLKVAYPVVQDNDFVIWNRYRNRYWPAWVVIDKRGIVRFTHVGEGAYAETEALVKRLLAEQR